MARNILKEILDNYNVWHRYQKRLINRAGHGERLLRTIKKKDFLRQEAVRQTKEEKAAKNALVRSKAIHVDSQVTKKEKRK